MIEALRREPCKYNQSKELIKRIVNQAARSKGRVGDIAHRHAQIAEQFCEGRAVMNRSKPGDIVGETAEEARCLIPR